MSGLLVVRRVGTLLLQVMLAQLLYVLCWKARLMVVAWCVLRTWRWVGSTGYQRKKRMVYILNY
jgi:hypothetical protein